MYTCTCSCVCMHVLVRVVVHVYMCLLCGLLSIRGCVCSGGGSSF